MITFLVVWWCLTAGANTHTHHYTSKHNQWWHMPVIPHRETSLCGFEASLVYKVPEELRLHKETLSPKTKERRNCSDGKNNSKHTELSEVTIFDSFSRRLNVCLVLLMPSVCHPHTCKTEKCLYYLLCILSFDLIFFFSPLKQKICTRYKDFYRICYPVRIHSMKS